MLREKACSAFRQATAYHSSVVVNGDVPVSAAASMRRWIFLPSCLFQIAEEYFFSDGGISFGSGLLSHKNPQNPDSKPEAGSAPHGVLQRRSVTVKWSGVRHGDVPIHGHTDESSIGTLLPFWYVRRISQLRI